MQWYMFLIVLGIVILRVSVVVSCHLPCHRAESAQTAIKRIMENQ